VVEGEGGGGGLGRLRGTGSQRHGHDDNPHQSAPAQKFGHRIGAVEGGRAG